VSPSAASPNVLRRKRASLIRRPPNAARARGVVADRSPVPGAAARSSAL